MAKAKPSTKKALTKSAVYSHLAEETGLKKTQIVEVMDAFEALIKKELGPKGPGVFTLPGIARFKIRKVAAVKGGVEKVNPLTGQKYVTKDKPAHNKLRILPVKVLSDSLK